MSCVVGIEKSASVWRGEGKAGRGDDSCSLAAAITIAAPLLFFPWCIGDLNRRLAAILKESIASQG